MKLLIYYSYNHNCFKARFSSDLMKKIGDVNGFGEELMIIVPLHPPRKGLSVKAHFINFLEKVIDNLKYGRRKKTKIVYIKKYIFPWWK